MGVQVVRYLIHRGYVFLEPRFGGDYVAVRAACIEPRLGGRVPSTIWWAKFLSNEEHAKLGYLDSHTRPRAVRGKIASNL